LSIESIGIGARLTAGIPGPASECKKKRLIKPNFVDWLEKTQEGRETACVMDYRGRSRCDVVATNLVGDGKLGLLMRA
jgi:hypothetical protein